MKRNPTTNNPVTAKGWLTPDERSLLANLSQTVPQGGTILNIGVEYGASIHCLRSGLTNDDVTIVAIDLIGGDKFVGSPDGIIFVRGDSGRIVKTWDTLINLAFIDGDHGYVGVTRDTLFSQHVVRGGYIAFHDCYSWPPALPKTVHAICPDVNMAVSDWIETVSDEWNELDPVDSIRVFRRI